MESYFWSVQIPSTPKLFVILLNSEPGQDIAEAVCELREVEDLPVATGIGFVSSGDERFCYLSAIDSGVGWGMYMAARADMAYTVHHVPSPSPAFLPHIWEEKHASVPIKTMLYNKVSIGT